MINKKISVNRRVTAQDVADKAGVSRSAVSRAFTKGAYLSDEKRKVIIKAAQELDYQPNALAAGLQGGRSGLVAVFIGEAKNEFDREMATALIEALNRAGKWPLVIGGGGEAARKAVSAVLRYPLEAMILRSGSLGPGLVERCMRLGVPVISSGRIPKARHVDTVCCRNAEGMAAGVRFLIREGRRRFAFIGGPDALFSSGARREGALQALEENGLSFISEARGDFSAESGRAAVEALAGARGADALICANDAMAIGAMGALRQRGVRIPDDIAVLGFDDIAAASLPEFALTTLRNPIPEAVSAIIALLLSRHEREGGDGARIFLDAELIKRASH